MRHSRPFRCVLFRIFRRKDRGEEPGRRTRWRRDDAHYMEEDPRRSTVPLDGPLFLDAELTLAPTLRQLILPYLQLDIKYFDLGLEYRDAVRRYASPSMCSYMLTVAYAIPIYVPTTCAIEFL